MRAQHDSTRQGGVTREAYNILLGHSMLWVLVLSATVVGTSAAAQDPVAAAPEPVLGDSPVIRDAAEESVPPTPGAATISLADAVATALKQNFNILAAVDSVASARMRETVARSEFYPKLTPSYGQNVFGPSFDLDVTQKLPYTGASISAEAGFRSSIDGADALPRTSNARLVLTQPLLRGLGPNAAHSALRNTQRSRQAEERDFEITRQRTAIQTMTAFYQVVLQRQLLGVARQSLKRSESLLKASEARLQVGLVSKLDVFRAELQAAQAQEAMLRAETNLEKELEAFRALLGLPATEAVSTTV